MKKRKIVAILATSGAQLLDVSGFFQKTRRSTAVQSERRGRSGWQVGPAGSAALDCRKSAEDLSVTKLAVRRGLSSPHFARLFRQEVGITPATWVKEARVAAARRLLESGKAVPEQVAAQCGFANADTLRRAFVCLVRCYIDL